MWDLEEHILIIADVFTENIEPQHGNHHSDAESCLCELIVNKPGKKFRNRTEIRTLLKLKFFFTSTESICSVT